MASSSGLIGAGEALIPADDSSLPHEDSESQDEGKQFKTYSRRFYVLAAYYMAIISASTVRLSFSSIDDEAQRFWGVDSTETDWLITGSYLMYPIGSVMGEIVHDHKGFVAMIRSAQALTVIGCIFRVLACFWENTWGYVLVLTGQILVAVGLPPLLNGAGVLATVWFPLTERDGALTFTVLAFIMGAGASYLLSVLLVDEADDGTVSGMFTFMGLELAANAAALVWLVQAVGEAPPTPPSAAAAKWLALEAEEKAARGARGHVPAVAASLHLKLDQVRELLRDPHVVRLVAGFSLVGAAQYSLFGLVGEYTAVAGFTDDQSAYLADSYTAAGLVSLTLLDIYLAADHVLLFPKLLWGITGAVIISGIGLVVAISSGSFIIAFVLAAVLGASVNALIPIDFTLIVEATFPMSGSLGIALTNSCTYMAAVVGTEALHYLIQWQPNNSSVFSGANCFLMALYLVGAAWLWSYRPQMRRYEVEPQSEELGSNLPPQQQLQQVVRC